MQTGLVQRACGWWRLKAWTALSRGLPPCAKWSASILLAQNKGPARARRQGLYFLLSRGGSGVMSAGWSVQRQASLAQRDLLAPPLYFDFPDPCLGQPGGVGRITV